MKFLIIISIVLLITNLYYIHCLARIVRSMVILKIKHPVSFKKVLTHPFFLRRIIVSLIPYVNIINLYEVFMAYHSTEDIDKISNIIYDTYK